ncbi:MAG: glycosyltransferase family 4 protein [Clostridia bacterium]|nr:glycosyltransferase family 4 protein [Clostridia bacterium]
MVKIAFVCQRYGLEVNGGSELHCRQLAEKLAALYDVTVYTTCALDYTTWENYYAEGEEMVNGIRVKRYPVAKKRVQESFDQISAKVFSGMEHSDADEKQWLEEQGPYCPAVLEAVAKEHGEYRAVFFMTYLYYLTATGLPMGLPNAMLIPTVHDEPPVYLRHYEKVFAAAKRICWNTEVEKAFATKRFPMIQNTPGIMVGVGIDGPQGKLPEIPDELKGKRYLVYAGRIDVNKGCGEMFEYFLRLKKEQGSDLKLVLMGKPVIKIPNDPDIIPLGFVSEEMKFAVMKEAFALVLFSRFESLSMVVLESMLMGRPVLVSGKCEVLKEHCIRSGAGLYFDFYQEFAGCVRWMEEHPEAYRTMQESGIRYVKENYSWDVITEKYHALIDNFGKE